jgi:lysophospholipase L1-like esterase
MKKILIILASTIILILIVFYFVHIIPETIQTQKPGQQYIVSLGDSVAAGAGLDASDSASNNSCDLSASAYPILLGQQLHRQVEQFACSGATVASGRNSLNTQFHLAESYIKGSDVVVYAGANDVGWLQELTSCVYANCNTDQNRASFAAKLQKLKVNLTVLLGQVQSQKPKKLVVNTYYQLAENNSSCFTKLGITPQDINYINSEESLLNGVIASAASSNKASTVNVNFSGHFLCDPESWIQGITASAPLHPTAAGQQQIATQDYKILSLTN